ncbi:hypothetical protein EOA32_32400 [Mesorhizobium sp. M1A.F.Ca.ET.072.01.1.1]|uniref:hypothetical protein n=1 Tax=Mesorhizobium sp. M1A.F.Ca.ET.072.01.1.1 TaxID=2496753 RepID=UPI000FD2D485|nr:hypothetical protein [Mesorhizobium sp. M1A.F.Ca.ET.072.01.1.1]RUW46138.1 hypothetical protein EOA32_32400 [Mesorhizobium sp. M1A.F.Ca.ET.072.01.1.1]TIU98889.1 MAG: hypothetical protein E5W04_22620 [Mesorhizobium sp.]
MFGREASRSVLGAFAVERQGEDHAFEDSESFTPSLEKDRALWGTVLLTIFELQFPHELALSGSKNRMPQMRESSVAV